jgi:uncharacterized membrane protein
MVVTDRSALDSERIVVSAPMSFSGSTGRIKNLTKDWHPALFWLVGFPLLMTWWTLIVCWYVCFGLLLVPYRLVRRGSRKRARDEARHRELLAELQQQSQRQEAP